MKQKFELYKEAEVKEYWIIYPEEETILIYSLENGKYISKKPIVDDYIASPLFPILKIHTNDIFR